MFDFCGCTACAVLGCKIVFIIVNLNCRSATSGIDKSLITFFKKKYLFNVSYFTLLV